MYCLVADTGLSFMENWYQVQIIIVKMLISEFQYASGISAS